MAFNTIKTLKFKRYTTNQNIKRKDEEQLRLCLKQVLEIDALSVKILEPDYMELGKWDHWDYGRGKTSW